MEPTPVYYKGDKFMETGAGNKFNKKCMVRGADAIEIGGKSVFNHGCILRGDLAKIKLGKYLFLDEGCVLKPPSIYTGETTKFVNMVIGDFVIIGQGSVITSAKIGSNVIIGKNCIISHRSMIHDNCKILDNTYLPPDTVVPPYTVYGGNPGKYISELPESTPYIHQEQAMIAFNTFIKEPNT